MRKCIEVAEIDISNYEDIAITEKVLLYNIRWKGQFKLYLQCDLSSQSYTNCDKDILGV